MDRRLLICAFAWGCQWGPDLPFCSVLLEQGIREEMKPMAVVDEQGRLSFEFERPVHGFEVETPRGRWTYSEHCEEAGTPCVSPPVVYPGGRQAAPLVPGKEYRARTYVWCTGAGNAMEMIQANKMFTAPDPEALPESE